MSSTTSPVKSVKILADLLEPGDPVIEPSSGESGVVARIRRTAKRLRVNLLVELEDGRSFEVNATKFLRQAVGS